MSIRLVRPTFEHKEEALTFKKEFIDYGEKEINGSEMLDHLDSYDNWLSTVQANADPERFNSSWVLTDTFFAVNDTGN